MEKKLILRGLFSGAVAGLLAFVFARVFAEPQITRAVDYENGRDAAQEALDTAAGLPEMPAGHELFSRTVQADVGLGVGLVAVAIALGGLFAVVFTIAYGRVGFVRARSLALRVALACFLTVYLVPFLKYPANPPAIGDHETIARRGALYLCMVAASIVLGVLAVAFGRQLRARYSAWTSTLLAGAGFVVAVGVLMALLPNLGSLSVGGGSTETPQPLLDPNGNIVFPGFPADVLAAFRLYSVGVQVILWGVIGLVFAPLAARLLEPDGRQTAPHTQPPQTPAVDTAPEPTR